MRVDGSLKTVTAGVTSLDDKRHNGTFAKIVENFRCDPMRGLTRRPATEYITNLGGTIELDTAVFSVILQDTLYWVFILPTAGPSGSHLILVFDEEGVEQDVIDFPVPHSYFNTITGTDSVAHVVLEDTIYIANKNVEIEKIDQEEEWTKNSMLVIKQAPASFSKIEVTWTGSDNIQYTVEHTVPDFLEADVGTNTTAEAIQVLMLAAGSPDLIVVQGSTVGVIRADFDYADITATDGANDAVAATLNDETQDINNLPKYASHQSVVKVRPDKTSDRGQFWMRATAYIETDENESYADKKINEPLVEDAVMTVGENVLELLELHLKGFQRIANPDNPVLFPPFGALAPNTVQGELVNLMASINLIGDTDGSFLIQLDGVIASPELFSYIQIVNSTTGRSIFESPLFQDPSDPTTFSAINVFPVNDFIVGEDYDFYYEQLEGFFGFLPEVEWNECADPALLNHWNRGTLPHVLGLNSEGIFFTGPQQEMGLRNVYSPRAREAGNDETNPFPEFLSHTVNDLGKFQDRLVMLSGGTVSMSQTDKQHAWFRDTVTQQLATDPIGIKSTAINSLSLNHIVSHNNDALIFSKNAQYRLVGSTGMTSQNAALPQTTSYDNTGTAKPVSNASDVFFPIAYSTLFAGVSRFSVDKVSDSQDIALAITNHVQELIPGDIKHIAASSTLGLVFIVNNLSPGSIYVYEYVDSRREPQTAWSRWKFTTGTIIQNIAFKDNILQIVTNDLLGASHLLQIRMNPAATPGMHRVTYLDYLLSDTGINTTINLPSNYPFVEEDLVIYQGLGAPNPGAPITGWSESSGVITLPIDLDGGGAALGYSFRSTFMPSRRWIRDDSGTPQTASKFRITDYNFWAVGDTINVDILNAPTTWPTQVFTSDDPSEDAVHRVSFKQRHDEADIEIWTEDPFNTVLIQMEWRGTYIKVGRRF